MYASTVPARSPWISRPMIAIFASAFLLLAFPALSDVTGAGNSNEPSDRTNVLETPHHNDRTRAQIRAAVSTFVWAISNRQANVVWYFASEDN